MGTLQVWRIAGSRLDRRDRLEQLPHVDVEWADLETRKLAGELRADRIGTESGHLHSQHQQP